VPRRESNVKDLITLTEAADRAGLSLMTFRKRLRESQVTIYINPRDRRERLVDWPEVAAIMEPIPINDAVKTAA